MISCAKALLLFTSACLFLNYSYGTDQFREDKDELSYNHSTSNAMTRIRPLANIFEVADIAQLISGLRCSDNSFIPGSILNIRDLSAFSRTSKGNYLAAQPILWAVYGWRRYLFNNLKGELKRCRYKIRDFSDDQYMRAGKVSFFIRLLDINLNGSLIAYCCRVLAKDKTVNAMSRIHAAAHLDYLGQKDEAIRILRSISETERSDDHIQPYAEEVERSLAIDDMADWG